ncbi:ribose 5-phosphate isomerase A [Halobacillus sp. A1]|uniref:ribose 5-phosphate isomerase A n=1 Tax=Halobacillus sp. A1 TaxID=2880262 RepID=UPI0020A686BE|nr:ribose 5-phosphate isomerase A [Halobacillus sp. A1]MCP3031019.1 ribose 5-phosphate isomerase A [Halobacillus sp. A1]
MKWKNPLFESPLDFGDISNRSEKEKLAEAVSSKVKDGDVIGVGSGSTAMLAIKAIGEKVNREKLQVKAVPTSKEAAFTCTYYGIPVSSLTEVKPDWGFDGADEVDSDKRLIKGRGGAMFMEKLVIASSPKTYILVDQSKFVTRLGEKAEVPIEVDPRAIHLVEEQLIEHCEPAYVHLRKAAAKDGPVITEAGNVILDVRLPDIPHTMEKQLKSFPGVVETGLFIGYSVEILYL